MPATASIPQRSKGQLWTADEFLDWLQPGVKAELIHGEKYMHSPVRSIGFLTRTICGTGSFSVKANCSSNLDKLRNKSVPVLSKDFGSNVHGWILSHRRMSAAASAR